MRLEPSFSPAVACSHADARLGVRSFQSAVTRNPVLLAALLLAMTAPQAAEPKGKNCSLVTAPDDAGYNVLLGALMRVYPSAEVIDASYTGCQVVWSAESAKAGIEMKVFYERGQARAVHSPDSGQVHQLHCNAQAPNRADGDCDFIWPLPVPTYPKECVKSRASPPDSAGAYIDRDCAK